MNTRPAIDESVGPVSLSVAFNQDSSCFATGLDSGFCGELNFIHVFSFWLAKYVDSLHHRSL